MRVNTLKVAIQSAIGATLVCTSVASAAPGVLSDKPLFLGTEVQPNILWLVDDSGSMNWEILKSEGALASSRYKDYRNRDYLDITPTRSDSEEMVESCAGYNVMYYDPTKKYTPWSGVDKNGDPYKDQSITAARNNPYDPGAGTRDLTDDETYGDPPGYFTWTDLDKDGVFDPGECPDPKLPGFDYNKQFTATVAGYGPAEMSDAEKTNFANWYSYYRKRDYVAKRALSQIIDSSQSRMGLATLWNRSSVGTVIKDVDDISTPIDSDAKKNKSALLKNLFRITPGDGTPLRKKLEQAGKYYDKSASPGTSLFGGSNAPSSPIFDAANGGECQQNFTVLMSDGYWNGSNPSVGNTDKDSANSPWDGGSYADTYSNTLADVAMHYYEKDLATGLDDNVPVMEGVDENEAQHMVTYTVAFGVNGTLRDGPDPKKAGQAFSWPDPFNGSTNEKNLHRIDDMRHAAWNGRGLFLSAGDPDTLINSLQAAIDDIADREGSASAVAFNSTSLKTDTLVFQARFDSGSWNGNLDAFAFQFNQDGTLKVVKGKTVLTKEWSAADKLDTRDLKNKPRQIITYNGSRGVPFKFPADYTKPQVNEMAHAQLKDLLADAPASVATTDPASIAKNQAYGKALVDYLRGDDSLEIANGGKFRDRYGKRLGDIIHSSPEFVGAPNRAYPNLIEGVGKEYSTFVKNKSGRAALVYIGANDGMLHAFNASSGEEVFAYVPGLLYSASSQAGLHYLAKKTYSHKAYVDESPLAADIYVNGNWRTYLIGALRAGGKGVYVLDVTNPSALTEANAASIVKKEFTHTDLGYTFSRPLVGKMNNGRWAAIFGNGYNASGDGRAKLFVMYLDSTGGYELIDTKVGSISGADCNAAGSDCNGLSSPTVLDMDGNGTVDRIYAGDIQGNVWSFDVSSKDATNWKVAYQDQGRPQPLFSACSATPCSAADRQPITSLSVVNTHPTQRSQSTEPNLMVYFGTGQYIASNDNLSTAKQTMYGVWDAGKSQLTRDQLQVQIISNSVSHSNARDLSSNSFAYGSGNGDKYGWYIDLPDRGERIVVEPVVIGDVVFFNTMVPDDASCNGGGYGYLMFADRMTGGMPNFTVFDINNDGIYDDSIVGGWALNAIPGGARLIDDKLVVSDSSGQISDYGVMTGKARPSSRASWSSLR